MGEADQDLRQACGIAAVAYTGAAMAHRAERREYREQIREGRAA
jgi:hypothetical protein